MGHVRWPVLVKTYACLFVGLTTKAIHIELCADLSTKELLAALRRFCARSGTPSHLYSDNGINFQSAKHKIEELNDSTTHHPHRMPSLILSHKHQSSGT